MYRRTFCKTTLAAAVAAAIPGCGQNTAPVVTDDGGQTSVSVSDYGDDIQAALYDNTYRRAVILHAQTYVTGQIFVPSGSTIFMEPGCIIRDSGILGLNDELLTMNSVQDIVIVGTGAEVQMDRAEYTTGQFRHGVHIVNSTNVTITGLAANDCGGDGFYIGLNSEDITLTDVSANNNRRQGMSITSGKNIMVTRPTLTNTTGTAPSAGLDIETNNNDGLLENIVINQPYTEGNDGSGIIVAIGKTPGIVDREITVTINDPVDLASETGLKIEKLDLAGNTVTGSIVVNNPVSTNPDFASIWVRNYDSTGPTVTINSPTSNGANQLANGSAKYGSAFTIFREASDTGATNVGAIEINNPTITDGANAPSYFHIIDLTGVAIENAHIYGTITASGIADPRSFLDINMTGDIDDDGEIITYDLTGDWTQNSSSYLKKFTNTAATGTHTVTLAGLTEIPAGAPEINFEVTSANTIVVTGDGISKQSNDVGATLVIQRETAGWTITTETGTWT